MANTTTSPNMNMPVPVPGVDPGIDWANNIVADMSIIDSHNHANGQGVQITPSGLNISTDLPMVGNNLTATKSVRFSSQSAPLSSGSDIGCVYESGVDLYYNDGNGNQVRITQGGSVTGSSGTITGLPSGTASASFAGSTFTFRSATNVPATMNVGPLVTGAAVANSKTVTLAASSSQPSNYNLTLPLALPAATDYVTLDSSGNMSFNSSGSTGSGAVVLATGASLTNASLVTPTIATPTFVGDPAGSIAAAAYTPTITFTFTSGSFTGTVTSKTFWYQRIGFIVSVSGIAVFNITASTGTVGFHTNVTLPLATASLNLGGSSSCRITGGVNAVNQSINSGITLVTEVGVYSATGNASSNYLSYNFMYQIV